MIHLSNNLPKKCDLILDELDNHLTSIFSVDDALMIEVRKTKPQV